MRRFGDAQHDRLPAAVLIVDEEGGNQLTVDLLEGVTVVERGGDDRVTAFGTVRRRGVSRRTGRGRTRAPRSLGNPTSAGWVVSMRSDRVGGLALQLEPLGLRVSGPDGDGCGDEERGDGHDRDRDDGQEDPAAHWSGRLEPVADARGPP